MPYTSSGLRVLASAQLYLETLYYLGYRYQNGIGVKKNLKKAVKWYKAAAKQGNSKAQNNLGYCYQNGKGVKKNPKKAVELFIAATKQGNSNAQNNLANCYELGEGVEKNMEKAVELYTAAANQGDFRALNNLGICYLERKGVGEDLKKAVELFISSALLGNPAAYNNLGLCCLNGKGVEKNYEMAAKLFKISSNMGFREAHTNLAQCYASGRGVDVNLRQALMLFTRAANQGDPTAQTELAGFYLGVAEGEEEVEVQVDNNEALKWLQRASDQQYQGAIHILDKLSAMGKVKGGATHSNQGVTLSKPHPVLKTILESDKEVMHQFKQLKELGTGGEGKVLKVIISGECYALKMITNYYKKNKRTLEIEYENEWNIVRSLYSEYIIQPIERFVSTPTSEMLVQYDENIRDILTTESGTAVETQFFIFEFHPVTLEDNIKNLRSTKQLDWFRILKYSEAVLRALKYLFEKEVVHNDVKMDNFLVSSKDVVILNDFGQSFLTQNHIADRMQLQNGNRMHKAPEIHNKICRELETIEVTKQYSWEAGWILYEIACGREPFIDSKTKLCYPLGEDFEKNNQIVVPKVEFPTMDLPGGNSDVVTFFTGIVQLLLQNDEEERLHIQDACLMMELYRSGINCQ